MPTPPKRLQLSLVSSASLSSVDCLGQLCFNTLVDALFSSFIRADPRPFQSINAMQATLWVSHFAPLLRQAAMGVVLPE